LIRSFFGTLKTLSATALSWRFPRPAPSSWAGARAPGIAQSDAPKHLCARLAQGQEERGDNIVSLADEAVAGVGDLLLDIGW
jgi:hypothetical protein